MLTLSNVTAHYGSSQALFGVDMQFKQGEIVTLLGRNGMGKTTTIHSIIGIVQPSGGSITLDGQELAAMTSYKIANLGIGLVPEGRQIFPNLSLRENLIATASNHLGVSDPWTIERVYTFFPELEQRHSSMGNLLSGGEQQMLAIGRALMTNPKILMLDEATEGLAPMIRQKIWSAITRIKESGISILLVDKNLKDLMKIADRHFIMQRGKIVWDGDSNQLQKDVSARERFLGV
ncbi:MAG: ABC transporter ATP-binding protein [Salaquimonas sp.]